MCPAAAEISFLPTDENPDSEMSRTVYGIIRPGPADKVFQSEQDICRKSGMPVFFRDSRENFSYLLSRQTDTLSYLLPPVMASSIMLFPESVA